MERLNYWQKVLIKSNFIFIRNRKNKKKKSKNNYRKRNN
jgi:hypothetical protein